ncbi:hypothetical protein N2152v2_000533 [Parachlorella kessleri]
MPRVIRVIDAQCAGSREAVTTCDVNKESTTLIAVGTDTGHRLASHYIFKGKEHRNNYAALADPGSAVLVKPETHFINGQAFALLLGKLADTIPGGVSPTHRFLFILDQHSSRLDAAAVTAATLGEPAPQQQVVQPLAQQQPAQHAQQGTLSIAQLAMAAGQTAASRCRAEVATGGRAAVAAGLLSPNAPSTAANVTLSAALRGVENLAPRQSGKQLKRKLSVWVTGPEFEALLEEQEAARKAKAEAAAAKMAAAAAKREAAEERKKERMGQRAQRGGGGAAGGGGGAEGCPAEVWGSGGWRIAGS